MPIADLSHMTRLITRLTELQLTHIQILAGSECKQTLSDQENSDTTICAATDHLAAK